MKVLTQPLTKREILEKKDEDNFVEGVVSVDVNTLIESDLEQVQDVLSDLLIGGPCLMQTDYKVVGHDGDHAVLLKVSGDVSDAIRA